MNNFEHIEKWLTEAIARKEAALQAGDIDRFLLEEFNEHNYRAMLEQWRSDEHGSAAD